MGDAGVDGAGQDQLDSAVLERALAERPHALLLAHPAHAVLVLVFADAPFVAFAERRRPL